ncbi:myb119, putative [Ricinus communis]|uniref:Myb119, putative n=2 Tax=Ricinus communis TaxID=3988 RepID=B9RB12_RICCO|nr:myb119, putative [Ricinus communis]
MDLYDYECKPLADINNIGSGGHGQVMDNFQNGGHLLHLSPIDMVGSNKVQGHMSLNLQEMKPISFVVPDEVSSVTANNHEYPKNVGVNKNNRVSASTRKTWKARKKNNVVKGQWTIDEDRLLSQLVEQYGIRKWSHIAQMLPGRIGKQCRERWHNHLRPDIKKDVWSEEEDKVLIKAHAEIGNKWAEIAKRLPGRTENSIKNHWNATKRRQYSKRKCRSKYPRGSLLQDYIKSLNLDPCPGRSYNQGKSCATDHAIASDLNNTMKLAQNNQPQVALEFVQNDRLVPNYVFNEVADFDFDEKIMFQEGCSFDSLLDGIPCDHHHNHVVDEKSFEINMAVEDDMTPLMMDFEVKKELDLVEMISQAKM